MTPPPPEHCVLHYGSPPPPPKEHLKHLYIPGNNSICYDLDKTPRLSIINAISPDQILSHWKPATTQKMVNMLKIIRYLLLAVLV